MNATSSIKVSVALNPSEREETVHFIEGVMRKRFLCEPPPTKGVIVTARSSSNLVGTMAVEGTSKEKPFALETMYGCHSDTSPFCRSETVVGTRWIAVEAGVSHLVFWAAAKLAYDLGKRYVLLEAKPYAVKRLRVFGITCHLVEGATLDLERINKYVGEDGMGYYRTNPLPSLYLLSLEEIVHSYP